MIQVPLSSLRECLPEDPKDFAWQVGLDGLDGRALLHHVPATMRLRLALPAEAELRGRLRLMREDWRDGTAAVRATITAEVDGEHRPLWSGLIASAARGGDVDGREFRCEVPASARELALAVVQDRPRDDRSVGRVLWVDPVLRLPDPAVSEAQAPEALPQPGPAAEAPQPLISVLTPVHNPPVEMLVAAVRSVREQVYENWELVLVDDGSSDPEVIQTLEQLAASDSRIRLQRREQAGGISSATNAALELAQGEYVALLDHDDVFMPDALARMVAVIGRDPDTDMIYSDEAVLYDDGSTLPIVKPGWSPDAMRALMYTCHLGVYRRRLAVEVGAFNSEFDGCQDYDFVLRMMEHTDRVVHIPQVLYHWRAHASSTAGGDQAKPYAYVSQPEAIRAHLRRVGTPDAEVQFGPHPGMHRIVYPLPADCQVTLVVAVADTDSLTTAARSWLSQPHANWSAVLITTPGLEPAVDGALGAAGVDAGRYTTLTSRGPVTVADLATAAAHVPPECEVMVLMEAPAVGLTYDWLARVAGYARQPGVACAGPVVVSEHDRLLHSGVALPDGLPIHLLYGLAAAAAQPAVADVSALDGVVATGREWFRRLEGVDPGLRELALIDYCLRAADAEGRSVLIPDARLQMAEAPVSNDLIAGLTLRARLRSARRRELSYNGAYRPDRGDFSLR